MSTFLNKIIDEVDAEEESIIDFNKVIDNSKFTTVYANEFENLDMRLEFDGLAILDSSEILEEEIIGPDDTRSRITNLISPPYRWICSIKTTFFSATTSNTSITAEGTGLLIGDRFILTAAHILHYHFPGHGTLTAKRVLVYPGRNGASRTFGVYGYESFRYLNKWKNSLDSRFDFAIIKLKRAPGTRNFPSKTGRRPLGWWGNPSLGYGTIIKGGGKHIFANRKINLSGYPSKEPGTGKNIVSSPTQWISFDYLHQITPRYRGKSANEMISYKNDATKSQSGSPIWTYDNHTGERNLVAIHHGVCKSGWNGCYRPGSSQESYNLGVHISTSVRNQIQQWKQSM